MRRVQACQDFSKEGSKALSSVASGRSDVTRRESAAQTEHKQQLIHRFTCDCAGWHQDRARGVEGRDAEGSAGRRRMLEEGRMLAVQRGERHLPKPTALWDAATRTRSRCPRCPIGPHTQKHKEGEQIFPRRIRAGPSRRSDLRFPHRRLPRQALRRVRSPSLRCSHNATPDLDGSIAVNTVFAS